MASNDEGGSSERPAGKGLTRGVWRVLTYGVRRPMQDMRASAAGLRGAWSTMLEKRARRRQQSAAVQQDYEARMAGLSPSERFAKLVEEGGWTAQELQRQLAAARRARRACLVMCAAGFVLYTAALVVAPYFFVLIFGVLAVAVLAGCLALAIRNAWWEFELQGRALIPLSEFVSRPDLFRRLFA